MYSVKGGTNMQGQDPSIRSRGVQLLRSGSASQSIPFLELALEQNPEDVELYLYLGIAYSMSGRNVESIDLLEHATSLAPASSAAHFNLGVAHQKAGHISQARDAYVRALNLEPGNDRAQNALDAVLKLQAGGGDTEKAA
jgi:Flp pilus assembly protein TadD